MSSSSSSLSSCPIALFNSTCITDSPCKVDFNFIADCAIPNLPDPIYDCSPPICPAFEPAPVEFCPEITDGFTKVNVKYLSRCSSSSSGNSQDTAGRFIVTKTVDCNFILGLDLDIPIKAPPCPIFTTKQTPSVNVSFDKASCTKSSNTLTITPIPGDCEDDAACQFDINLDLNVPIPNIPCPTFTRNNPVTVTTKFSDCVTGNESTLTVDTTPIPGDCNTPDTCQFDINLDLIVPIPKIPCPTFASDNPVTVTAGFPDCVAGKTSKLTVNATPVPGDCNTPETCQFDIALDLVVPIPRTPCPTINSQQAVSVTPYYKRSGCQQKTSTFTVATTPIPGNCTTPETCQFDFDLDLFVPLIDPPCPQFNNGKVTVTPYYNNTTPPRQSAFNITQVLNNPNCDDPKQCEFDINLDLMVPIPVIPCPVFRFNSSNVYYRSGNQFAINDIQVVPMINPPNIGDPCEFNIFLDVTVPAIAGQITVGPTKLNYTQRCDVLPEYKLMLGNPDINGVQELYLDIVLPSQPIITGGPIDLGQYGSGSITVDNNDPCVPQVTAKINLYTTGCASTGGGGGSSSTTGGGCNCQGPYGTCPPGCTCFPTDNCNVIPI